MNKRPQIISLGFDIANSKQKKHSTDKLFPYVFAPKDCRWNSHKIIKRLASGYDDGILKGRKKDVTTSSTQSAVNLDDQRKERGPPVSYWATFQTLKI